MAKISQKTETAVRNRILKMVADYLSEELATDALQVSASEYSFPILNDDGEEIFANIKVSIPRGTRCEGGYEPYDGYAMAEDWQITMDERNKRKEKIEQKKAEAEAEKERRRLAKKALKTLKEDIKEVLPKASEM